MKNGLHYLVWREHEKVELFRFVQEERGRVRLELIPSCGDSAQKELVETLRRGMTEYLGPDMKAEIEVVDEIEDDHIKFRSFISLVSDK